jgi:hypothetical protein
MRRSILLSGAAALGLVIVSASTPARAGSVNIDTGSGTAQATGTATGATIAAYSGAHLNSINGSPVTGFGLGIAENIKITSPTSGTGTKVISYGGSKVQLEMTVESVAATVGSITTTAKIVSLTGTPVLDGFNFATLIGGTTVLTETKANYNFAALLGSPGATAKGNFGVVESVPEPTSMALLGIGMTGFVIFRRRLKRSKTA